MSSRRILILGCQLGLVWALAAILLKDTAVFKQFENYTWDLRVQLLAQPVDVPVKLILIDQDSVTWGANNGYSWPWNRLLYSMVLSFCERGKVKALAFDMMYRQPHQDAGGDDDFGKAIFRMPRFVGGAVIGNNVGEDAWPDGTPPNPFRLHGLSTWTGREDAEIFASRGSFSIPEVRIATHIHGHVRGVEDPDVVFRRVVPVQIFRGQTVPLLSIAAYLIGQTNDADPSTALLPEMRIERDVLHIGERAVPLAPDGTMRVYYYRPRPGTQSAFETYPIQDVLESEQAITEGKKPKLSPEVFRDCYVLFGVSAGGLYDVRPTPLETKAPGVEIHATILANLLRGDTFAYASTAGVGFFTVLLSVFAGAVTTKAKKTAWIILAFALLLPVPMVAGIIGYKMGVWGPVVAPTFAVALSLTSGVILNYATEGRQRRVLRRVFGQYLSPKVIEQMLADPTQLRLGGIDRELTMFFTDLEGFSSISERLTPQEITLLLNECLSEVSQAVFGEDGTLDKYVGDAVVAFWNAPAEQPDHAVRALRAAIHCQVRLAQRMPELLNLTKGLPLRVRIGIHTGHVVVGNLGSPQRFNYSMLGDAANLASRLEGANKAFGTHIMVSKETWDATGGAFLGREIGRIVVAGREAPVTVFEPMGVAGDPLSVAAAAIDLQQYSQAIMAIHERRFDDALAIFESLPDDPVARVYVKHLRRPEVQMGWDGVWRLSEK